MWYRAGPLSPVVGGGQLTDRPSYICVLLCLCHLSGPQREKPLINIFPHCKTHTLSFIFDWWQKRRAFFWTIQWKIDTLPEYKAKGNQNLFLIITDMVGDSSRISLTTFWVFNYLLCIRMSHTAPHPPKLQALDMQSGNILFLAISSSTIISVERMRETWINVVWSHVYDGPNFCFSSCICVGELIAP